MKATFLLSKLSWKWFYVIMVNQNKHTPFNKNGLNVFKYKSLKFNFHSTERQYCMCPIAGLFMWSIHLLVNQPEARV